MSRLPVATVSMGVRNDALGSRLTFTSLTDFGKQLPAGRHDLYTSPLRVIPRGWDLRRDQFGRVTIYGPRREIFHLGHTDDRTKFLNAFCNALLDAEHAVGVDLEGKPHVVH